MTERDNECVARNSNKSKRGQGSAIQDPRGNLKVSSLNIIYPKEVCIQPRTGCLWVCL